MPIDANKYMLLFNLIRNNEIDIDIIRTYLYNNGYITLDKRSMHEFCKGCYDRGFCEAKYKEKLNKKDYMS